MRGTHSDTQRAALRKSPRHDEVINKTLKKLNLRSQSICYFFFNISAERVQSRTKKPHTSGRKRGRPGFETTSRFVLTSNAHSTNQCQTNGSNSSLGKSTNHNGKYPIYIAREMKQLLYPPGSQQHQRYTPGGGRHRNTLPQAFT